jgi:MPBQ/MSBQ methyltransferase
MCCAQATGEYEVVEIADWTPQTLPTWRHSIWVGVWDPWIVIRKGPAVWYKVIREIVMIERMHRAFDRGLMVYGMARAVRKKAPPAPVVEEAVPMAVPISA